MDWFSWLSRTSLGPSLVHEYGLTFSHNELEEDDIPYLNHEFLQSMGISIAKHRLEILKLANKSQKGCNTNIPHPMSRILVAIKRTKMRFSKCLREWLSREESALALVPSRSHSSRWKNAMAKRKKKKRSMVVKGKQIGAPLLLTNGSPDLFPSTRINSFSSPFVHDFRRGDDTMDGDYCDDEYLPCAVEEIIRWDTMFQNLKPT